jgi:dnd system-associated protein 4
MPAKTRATRGSADRDRFYVQKDKHAEFQRLSQADEAPFGTMKDVWVLAASMGFRAGKRLEMRGGTQHVGFWHYLSAQEDIPLLQAIAVADSGDIRVLADQGQVIRIAEEYANAGIDLLLEFERLDRDSTLRALASSIVGQGPRRVREAGDMAVSTAEKETAALIAMGESARVEFKETARWNDAKGGRDKVLEEAVLKTIAGFMNALGGTLLIGVTDAGEPVGIDRDLKTVQGRASGTDAFENWLTTLTETHLGTAAATDFSVRFERVGGAELCRVDIQQNVDGPVYCDVGGEATLYVRTNNSTRKLDSKQATTYIQKHWR